MVETNNTIASLSGRVSIAENNIDSASGRIATNTANIASLSGSIISLSGVINTRIDAIQLTLS